MARLSSENNIFSLKVPIFHASFNYRKTGKLWDWVMVILIQILDTTIAILSKSCYYTKCDYKKGPDEAVKWTCIEFVLRLLHKLSSYSYTYLYEHTS